MLQHRGVERIDARFTENCAVDRVVDPAFEIAVHIGEQERSLRHFPRDVDVAARAPFRLV